MRRVRRKVGNKEKVFGCDLLEHLASSSQDIPQVLRSCSDFVETHGIVDGIYRLSGVSSNIQKLRGEFENDSSPDLNKDLYLQDIHCVSSLCKAYFRELPNPLLTYQLYDKFAEAVAIQLEEERLVKIRDVLKELPQLHYRTLEFLMRHLVRMASYSSETNMHARNLAIVWAPNLLRSKDIEASGFNGTAAFMEVRVQSIVVEFILTHVPQLFPEQGVTAERRKSIPVPTAASCPGEEIFKCVPPQSIHSFGHISPGDGPLPIRPYHAIIEGTDKRKGSLKGRKWMSIFNIGGRFQDPRRRHKHSAKEKERPVLRPARSMDSLSTPSFPSEGARRPGQRPPSTNMSVPSPLITSSPKPGSEAPASGGALGGSEYAVTYRRGTGLVSGGMGTQGTYTALDPDGMTGNETVQSRSPGLSTKVGRRAAMHITGPTLVTVPLHITSNLALGVLQGGGGDRVIHRGRDKDGGDKVEDKEGGEKVEMRESRGRERKEERAKKVKGEEKSHGGTGMEGVVGAERAAVAGDREDEGRKDEEEAEVTQECGWRPELVPGGHSPPEEPRARSLTSNAEEDNDDDAASDKQDVDENKDHLDSEEPASADLKPEATQQADDAVFDSDVLSSPEVEGDDLGLSGYVQDNFEFLDQMDCSVLDHMDCSVPYQVNEFSVEPPGHSDDEFESMEEGQPSYHPLEHQTQLLPSPEAQTQDQEQQRNPHRPLSLDIHSRHTKSLSLPYMTSPVLGPEESCSEEEVAEDDSDDDDYSSEEDDSMFVKSLPADFLLKDLNCFELDVENENHTPDGAAELPLPTSEESHQQTLDLNTGPVCNQPTPGHQEEVELKDEDSGLEEKEIPKTEEEDVQSCRTTEDHHMEDSLSDKEQPPTCCSTDCPQPSSDEPGTAPDVAPPPQQQQEEEEEEEEEEEVVDNICCDRAPCLPVSCATQKEIADATQEDCRTTKEPRNSTGEDRNEGDSDGWCEDKEVHEHIEDTCGEMIVEMKGSEESMFEENIEEDNSESADGECGEKRQEACEVPVSEMSGTGREIWDELEDVICEVIEDEERKMAEMESARRCEAEETEAEEDRVENMVKVEDGSPNETDVRMDVVEGFAEAAGAETDVEMQQKAEEKDRNLAKGSEQDEAIQRKDAVIDEARLQDREDVPWTEKEKRQSTLVKSDMKEVTEDRKCEESDSSLGGVGRKLVVSKNPKIHQVKAVPVVPPKPQHCKITAMTLRQQQQQRERREADRGREKFPAEPEKVGAGDPGTDGGDGDEGRGKKEKPVPWGGERERERWREGEESAARDASRNSPLSMCFDEAVAMATMRREKEKENEKEWQRDWGNEVQ
ncbi:uncharacterized protein V6R79_016957 [Siganus canaliculatus]